MKSTAALIFVTSLTFMQASHPIALMALILLQTLFCCLFLASYAVSSWFSFILFLIFLGGLMVLFIYISSLASNEKFVVSLKKTHLSLFTVIGLPMMIAATWHSQTAAYNYSNEVNLLTKMYTTSIFTPTVTVMSYLLLTLIVVVKMTSKYEGPLRNIIFK